MSRNGGYILVGLCRCNVCARYFVPQFLHCSEYNHFSNNCPGKCKIVKCRKSGRQHKTDNCRSTHLKCVNCLKTKVISSKAHVVNSRICPNLLKEQNQIQKRTNHSHEKKYSSFICPEVALRSAYLTHIP